jgi:hypothetical protein
MCSGSGTGGRAGDTAVETTGVCGKQASQYRGKRHLDEAIPVGIVTKDAATLDTPADDVMECVRGVDA